MLDAAELVAFVATTDLDRARGFYAGVLGLRMIEQDGFAVVFDSSGTALRVTLVGELAPAPYTVLGWAVADIGSSAAALADRGVRFTRYDGMDQDEQGVWTAPGGTRVAWFTDPDGNTLSISQHGTE
jgi:catechol 2,3-dioxygenase-like lactoylglutathione lyase family enzyme